MTHRSLVARRTRRTTIIAAASFATAFSTLSGVGSAGAAEPPVPANACTPFDEDSNLDSDALAGTDVTGLTTSSGTTPDEFTGEVLGVIDDGIAPDVDLIMARLTSAEIDRVGGIWYGMSGSPVYAPDGTLLGAVAYGLSWGPSPVAGITPAAAMFDVADRVSDAAPAGKVAIPASLQRKVVGRTQVTARAADSGMRALRTPLGVSGVPTDMKLRKVKRKLDVSGVKMFRSSPAPVNASAAAAEEIVPGGNLAAGISYGEVSAIGYGTATAVCDGKVVGFGHPFDYRGETSLTMHGGSTVYVQEDALFGSYKLVNPSAPVGTITQDRLAGIAGTEGEVPESTRVTSTVTDDANDNGRADAGERTRTSNPTFATDDYWLDYVSWLAQLYNVQVVFDNFGPGSATTRYTIKGKADNAGVADAPFTLRRGNRFQSDWSIPYGAAYDVADTIWTLYRNDITDVDFDSVSVNTVLSTEARLFRVRKVEVQKDGEWKAVRNYRSVTAKAGGTLKFRVQMESYRDKYGSRTARFSVPVPEVSRRSYGYMSIGGGDRSWRRVKGDTFAELIQAIENRPRNDELVADMQVRERGSGRQRVTVVEPVGDVVRGGKFLQVRIRN